MSLREGMEKATDKIVEESHEENAKVVAHGNSIIALVKYLDYLSNNEIMGVNIPTGFSWFMNWTRT